MAFSPQFLDEIRARLPLAEVIGKRVRLVRRGREHVALCPFHNEKTPSFTVSEDKGFFHCFGCGAHGDVIGFAMRAENLSFPEAVERLAREAGLDVPVQSPAERVRSQEQLSLYGVVEAAAVWFEEQLKSAAGASSRDYLTRRGLDRATIEKFRLGFAPDKRGTLKQALISKGIAQEMIGVAGLLIQPEDGSEPFERFRNRIIFPISDRRGRVVAFGGRALAKGGAKYLNSPETPLFHKSALLYGLSFAAERARKKRTVVVVEGYMDVLTLHRAGIENAVAPLGTALTEFQIEELWRLAPEPVVCFDGDEAGARAAYRAAERVLQRLRPGKSLRFAFLPQGEDPDSLIVGSGPASFREVLSAARPLHEVLWSMATGEGTPDTPERQAAALSRLMALVEQIPQRDLRTYYAQHFRMRLWQAARARRPKGKKWPSSTPAPISPDALRRSRRRKAAHRERAVLRILLNYPALLSEFADELGELELETARYRDLRDALIGAPDRADEAPDELGRYLADTVGSAELVEELAGKGAGQRRWALPAGKASIEDARTQLRHLMDLHHRLVELEASKREAEQAFMAHSSEENWERFLHTFHLLQQAPGFEAEIPEYEDTSDRERA